MSELGTAFFNWLKSCGNPIVRIYLARRLKRCSPAPGYTAYIERKKWRKGEPDYLACSHCYEQARRQPMQCATVPLVFQDERRYAVFRCPSCSADIHVDLEEPIIPAYAELRGNRAPRPK